MMKYITKPYWYLASHFIWKTAFQLLRQTRCITHVAKDGVWYETVFVRRYYREQQRRAIAYRLATNDNYKESPEHYWHEARKSMISASNELKKAGKGWAER